MLVLVALFSATSAPLAIALGTHHPSVLGTHHPAARPHTQAPPRPHARVDAHASIVGGTPAEDGSFPSLAYIVDVQGKYIYQCTGTVVAADLVLTAGHCAENMKTGVVNKPSGYRVVTGTVDPLTPEPRTSTVAGVIVYPGLVRRVDEGDAALLVLATPTTAPAITLATSANADYLRAGSQAVMAGWGIASYEQKLPTERLRSAATVVQGRKWCAVNAPPFYARNEICTIAAPTDTTGACAGDSGGPLLVPGPGGVQPIEIGVAVHVYGKCSTRRPSVYTSAASISSWVHTWIQAYASPPVAPAPSPPAPPSPVPSPPVPSPPVLPTPVSSPTS